MNEIIRAGLTDQQARVADLLLEGLRNHEIAARLKLSPRTIKQHLRNLSNAFQISSGAGQKIRLACKLASFSVNCR